MYSFGIVSLKDTQILSKNANMSKYLARPPLGPLNEDYVILDKDNY